MRFVRRLPSESKSKLLSVRITSKQAIKHCERVKRAQKKEKNICFLELYWQFVAVFGGQFIHKALIELAFSIAVHRRLCVASLKQRRLPPYLLVFFLGFHLHRFSIGFKHGIKLHTSPFSTFTFFSFSIITFTPPWYPVGHRFNNDLWIWALSSVQHWGSH